MGEVLVIGAGLSGLSAALFLARSGTKVEIWESSDRAGGLLAPVRFRGFELDRGAHRVHPSAHPALWRVAKRREWLDRPRRGRLVLGGRKIPYPPEPIGFLRGIGLKAALEMSAGFMLSPERWRRFRGWEQDRNRALEVDEGFESFVVERVGRSAYRRFYRPYVEKVWGEPARRLSRSVAKQRVSTRSPLAALAAPNGRFLYPRRGMASVIASLREELELLEVPIHYGKKASRDSIGRDSHRIILHSGHLRDVVPNSRLEHRGLYLLHVAVPDRALEDDADTYYLPEEEFWIGRVSRVDRFSPELKERGEAILCLEIPEGRWGRAMDFVPLADELKDQLVRARVLCHSADMIELRQTFVPGVYPLYTRGWLEEWSATLDELARIDPRIIPFGRQGLFLHCNMDHCVRIAEDAAEHVSSGSTPAAWRERAARYLDLRVRD
jgi:UDP-galactopyranose mutase